ncbi:hypothetical protein VTN77DRAFT_4886 [Rasamsonia byssochlamydoides]|uniref:uncharacterized protein n=1 Tax=Rasamsonia byssochlamydoides TaxID=89139 RepID=UPI003742B44D
MQITGARSSGRMNGSPVSNRDRWRWPDDHDPVEKLRMNCRLYDVVSGPPPKATEARRILSFGAENVVRARAEEYLS